MAIIGKVRKEAQECGTVSKVELVLSSPHLDLVLSVSICLPLFIRQTLGLKGQALFKERGESKRSKLYRSLRKNNREHIPKEKMALVSSLESSSIQHDVHFANMSHLESNRK